MSQHVQKQSALVPTSSPQTWCCQMQPTAPNLQPAVSLNNLQGGYWTLDKRQADLHRMPAEWRRTVASFAGSFPQVFRRPSVQVSTCMEPTQVQPPEPVRGAQLAGRAQDAAGRQSAIPVKQLHPSTTLGVVEP